MTDTRATLRFFRITKGNHAARSASRRRRHPNQVRATKPAELLRAGPELPILTSTLERVVQGPVSGEPAAAWRFNEKPVVVW